MISCSKISSLEMTVDFTLEKFKYYYLEFKITYPLTTLMNNNNCNGVNRGSVQIQMQSYLLKNVVKTGRVKTLANRYGVGKTKTKARHDKSMVNNIQ